MNIPTFEPHFFFKNGHTQTAAAAWWPTTQISSSHHFKTNKIPVDDKNTLIVHSHMQEIEPHLCSDIVLVHGFEGSSESKYMLRMAEKALLRGYNVHRINLRSCGESIYTCQLPYHAGLWQDILKAIDIVKVGEKVFVVGYSLGGNLVLKMTGDLQKEIPSYIEAVASVSAPLDLKLTAEWLASQNFYHRLFLSYIMKNYYHKKKLFPEVYPNLENEPSSLIEFDDKIVTAIYNFKDANDYYKQSSCCHVLQDIEVPTLIIYAEDDPVIPKSSYHYYSEKLRKNNNIEWENLECGGHVAFIANYPLNEDRFWIDERIYSFFSQIQC